MGSFIYLISSLFEIKFEAYPIKGEKGLSLRIEFAFNKDSIMYCYISKSI